MNSRAKDYIIARKEDEIQKKEDEIRRMKRKQRKKDKKERRLHDKIATRIAPIQSEWMRKTLLEQEIRKKTGEGDRSLRANGVTDEEHIRMCKRQWRSASEYEAEEKHQRNLGKRRRMRKRLEKYPSFSLSP